MICWHDFLLFMILKSPEKSDEICFRYLSKNPACCFRAAVRAFSLACPADYCFFKLQIAYIVIFGK